MACTWLLMWWWLSAFVEKINVMVICSARQTWEYFPCLFCVLRALSWRTAFLSHKDTRIFSRDKAELTMMGSKPEINLHLSRLSYMFILETARASGRRFKCVSGR